MPRIFGLGILDWSPETVADQKVRHAVDYRQVDLRIKLDDPKQHLHLVDGRAPTISLLSPAQMAQLRRDIKQYTLASTELEIMKAQINTDISDYSLGTIFVDLGTKEIWELTDYRQLDPISQRVIFSYYSPLLLRLMETLDGAVWIKEFSAYTWRGQVFVGFNLRPDRFPIIFPRLYIWLLAWKMSWWWRKITAMSKIVRIRTDVGK